MSRHSMACLSWSPSSLPGGVIGAREQPHEGRTMRNRRPARRQRRCSDWRSVRCSADGIGVQHCTGFASSMRTGRRSRPGWSAHWRRISRHCSPSLPCSAIRGCCRSRSNAVKVGRWTDRCAGSSCADGRARCLQGNASAVGRGWSEVRRRRRIHARRLCPHRRTPPAQSGACGPGHPGARRPRPGKDLPSRGTYRGIEPVLGRPCRALARSCAWSSRNSHRRSRWRS